MAATHSTSRCACQRLRPGVVRKDGQGQLGIASGDPLFRIGPVGAGPRFHLIIRARVCETWKGVQIVQIVQIFGFLRRDLHLHSRLSGQVEDGAQMDFPPSVAQGGVKEAVGIPLPVFGRERAKLVKHAAPRLAAVGGDGKGQLKIFTVGGRDVRPLFSDGFQQPL